MAWHDGLGNPPINSTGFAPISAGSTDALYAELDSTRLGTANFVVGQSRIFLVSYLLGADTNCTWQVGPCTSTALGAGADEFFPKTAAFQSGQFVFQHTLEKDYRLRVRQFSTAANGAAYISAVPLV
jgi:hypothetical protein